MSDLVEILIVLSLIASACLYLWRRFTPNSDSSNGGCVGKGNCACPKPEIKKVK